MRVDQHRDRGYVFVIEDGRSSDSDEEDQDPNPNKSDDENSVEEFFAKGLNPSSNSERHKLDDEDDDEYCFLSYKDIIESMQLDMGTFYDVGKQKAKSRR